MTGKWTVTLAAALAFAAGVAVGVYRGRDCLNRVRNGRQTPSDAFETNASTGIGRCACGRDCLNRVGRVDAIVSIASAKDGQTPETIVEVTYADTSDEPSPDITAAHRARQAKRAAAREAKSENRRDFLANLNSDLLTAAQKELHAEYTEAIKVRDAARREMDALRAKGVDVPDDLRKRFADAQSVICADAAEEHRALREAAARAHGLDEASIRSLLEDIESVDSALGK